MDHAKQFIHVMARSIEVLETNCWPSETKLAEFFYALTNPQHTPWRVPSRVLSADVPCKYCFRSICPEGHQNCLRGVTPDEVVLAAEDLLREVAQGPAVESVAC